MLKLICVCFFLELNLHEFYYIGLILKIIIIHLRINTVFKKKFRRSEFLIYKIISLLLTNLSNAVFIEAARLHGYLRFTSPER